MVQQTSKDVRAVQSPLALSAKQLGNRLGVSLRHIRRLDSAGKIPKPIRLGQSVRWPVVEIENWMAVGAPNRQRWEAMRGAKQ